MKNAAIQTKVNALTADFLKAADAIVTGVHSLGLDTPELQRPYVIKAVCAFTLKSQSAGWSESSSGKIMLDSSHEHYELIKTRVRRVMDTLSGKGEVTKAQSSGKTDPVDAIIKAFNKLDAKQQRAFLKAIG
jgi:hypothetical protein